MNRKTQNAFKALWLAINGQQTPGAPSPFRAVATMPKLILASFTGKYPLANRSKILLMIGAVAYLVSPIDLIPEFLALIGLTDDAVVLAWLAGSIITEADTYLTWQKGGAAKAEQSANIVVGQVVSS